MTYAKHAYDVAVSSVQSHAAIFGYVEMEAYTSANVYSPKCVESDRFGELNDIDQVLSKLNLRPIPVANGKLTNGAKELDAETTKSADLHLKITRKLKLADSEGFYSARALLLRHGFYEIIGESGNSIFTCQFLHANLAKRAFKNLSQAIDLRSTEVAP